MPTVGDSPRAARPSARRQAATSRRWKRSASAAVSSEIARWMYASLYKMHQVSIHGYLRVAIDTVSRVVRHRLEPRVKLH